MGLNKWLGFLCGLLFGVMVTACASAVFPYKYYGLDLKDQRLTGPTSSDDLDLAVCNSTAVDQAPCTAMMTDAFLALKKSYKDLQNELIACQQGKSG